MTIELVDVSEKGGILKAEGFGDGRYPIDHPQAPQGVPKGLPLEAATQSQVYNLQIHARRASWPGRTAT
ncbi:MAG: hypothetical protein ACYSTT_05785 [Planctomycetota bacterium]|jgi:hypothetical protein